MLPFVLGTLLALLPQAPVTRADLARAYQRFERAYSAATLTPERKRELNRTFDQATLAFFAGQGQAVIDGLEALSRELGAPASEPAPAEAPYDWDGLRTEMLLAINAIKADGPPLEQALAWLRDDELLEVTPKQLRFRKKILDHSERRVAERRAEAAGV